MLYIVEAHAVDEWPISSGRYHPGGSAVILRQPRTASERSAACLDFLSTYGLGAEPPGMGIAVDDPAGDAFQEAYAPWPIRMYVVEDGRMRFLSEPTECSHDVTALRAWLEDRFEE